ncbi:MAG: Rhomboid family protein [Bacteroidota bacterium]|nr:Rhomboid family protein [Bacteroidota bacterium]
MLSGSIIEDIKYQFRYGNMVMKLIFVNLGVFLFFGLFYVGSWLGQSFGPYTFLLTKLEVPASLNLLLYQPWTLFTYMFLHVGVLHVLFNMLWFYWFGEIFVLYLGDKKILPLYILGGLAGAFIYMLAYNFIPVFKLQVDFALMLGASASIYAIVFAAATINPDHEIGLLFFGNVKIKYVAIISLLMDVINIPSVNAGGLIAHVGGALCGFLYIKALRSGISFTPVKTISALFRSKPKVKMSYRSAEKKQEPTQTRNSNEQARVDEILDKIARSGYDSLTKEEKDFLFNFSKK